MRASRRPGACRELGSVPVTRVVEEDSGPKCVRSTTRVVGGNFPRPSASWPRPAPSREASRHGYAFQTSLPSSLASTQPPQPATTRSGARSATRPCTFPSPCSVPVASNMGGGSWLPGTNISLADGLICFKAWITAPVFTSKFWRSSAEGSAQFASPLATAFGMVEKSPGHKTTSICSAATSFASSSRAATSSWRSEGITNLREVTAIRPGSRKQRPGSYSRDWLGKSPARRSDRSSMP
mmetsp:Transcript_113681/g.321895  ORF Transcript_113681/g.321895 Transcript_113681/m.321895 type:complete len:239 (+) Transcript_113681:550-1266(+)